MTYQLMHDELGIFQGLYEGLLLWYPLNNSPIFGIYEIKTKQMAEDLIHDICEKTIGPMFSKKDFTICQYDNETNTKLIEAGVIMIASGGQQFNSIH
jgi:hypothetical protein